MWEASAFSPGKSSGKVSSLPVSSSLPLQRQRQKRRGTFLALHNVALICTPPLSRAELTQSLGRYLVSGLWRFQNFTNGSAKIKVVPSLTRKYGKKRARTHGSYCTPQAPLVRRLFPENQVGFVMLIVVSRLTTPNCVYELDDDNLRCCRAHARCGSRDDERPLPRGLLLYRRAYVSRKRNANCHLTV